MSFAKIWFSLALGGMLAGCGDAHLGDLYGRRSRNAFDAQAQAAGKGDAAGTLDADDAKTALARHRGRALPGTPGSAMPSSGGGSYNFGGGGAASPIVGGGTTSAGIPASSPQGPIRLDAVR